MREFSVAVGTESALKLRAVRAVFSDLGYRIDVFSCKASSGVPNQPVGKSVMALGALNRALYAQNLFPNVDLTIALENGLVNVDGKWFDPVCIVILVGDSRMPHISFGAHFPIPSWMAERALEEQSELGHIVQSLAGGGEKDPMKWLSNGSVARETLLAQAIQCALVPVLHADRYQ